GRGRVERTRGLDVAPGDVARATKAIEELDLAHRRGLEPETLNYTNAASTRVEIWAGGKKAGEGAVHRSGLNPRTLTPPDDEPGRGRIIAAAPSAAGRGAARGAPPAAEPVEPAAGAEAAGARGAGGAGARGAGGTTPPATETPP